jgi:subtilase family serine protease
MKFKGATIKINIYLNILIYFSIDIQRKKMPLHLHEFSVEDWILHDRAHPHHKMTFFISLAYQNKETMHDELMHISDPTSPRYGQHYSLERLRSTFSISDASLLKITEFMEDIHDSIVEVNTGR